MPEDRGRILTGGRSTLLAFLLACAAVPLIAGPDIRGSVLIGRVVDSVSHLPIEGAIGFLENTPLGSATDSMGEFTIRGIPRGTFRLVVARIGYRRVSIDVVLGGSDTLSLLFSLTLQPVPTTGVDISAERPVDASLKPAQLFVPRESDGAYRYFGGEDLSPIGIYADDSSLYMYSLDTALIGGEQFIRLWLLYKNLTDFTTDFNPLSWITMDIRAVDAPTRRVGPAMPTYIKSRIDSSKLVRNVSMIIGAALRSDVKELRRLGADRGFESQALQGMDFGWGRSMGIASPEKGNDIFLNSANVGILARFRVEAGASVNGFIFFVNPNRAAAESGGSRVGDYCSLELPAQGGAKVIAFERH